MLQLKLVSPSQLVFDQQASKIEVPGVLGYLCVGSKHTPFLSELRPGIIRVYDQSYKVSHSYYVSGGYFQIEQDNATILADIVESKEEILTPTFSFVALLQTSSEPSSASPFTMIGI